MIQRKLDYGTRSIMASKLSLHFHHEQLMYWLEKPKYTFDTLMALTDHELERLYDYYISRPIPRSLYESSHNRDSKRRKVEDG